MADIFAMATGVYVSIVLGYGIYVVKHVTIIFVNLRSFYEAYISYHTSVERRSQCL